jgi:hypothetical protein
MIDFDKGERRFNKFLGSEKKDTVFIDGITYMIKYPDPIRAKKRRGIISYKNNQFSGYMGSRIFASCDINAQEVVLGYFTDRSTGKKKTVVGCKDFTQDGVTLYEMEKLANPIATDEGRLTTTIENVRRIINETELITDKKAIIDGFWDMFVIDALIGNKDRHFGNWGIIEKDGVVSIAPVYDCGSSLGAMLEDTEMAELLESLGLLKLEEYNISSVYSMDGKRLFYHEIFKNPPEDLKNAIIRTVPNINMDMIHKVVDSVSAMSDIRKTYLKKAMSMRFEQIILPSFKRAMKESQNSQRC